MRLAALLAVSLLAGAAIAQPEPAAPPAWNDISVIRENAEAPRAHFVPFPDAASALSGDPAANPWRRSLDGRWKFRYSESPAARPEMFYRQDYDVSAWADIPVPSNWEREGHGYAIYVNVPYPFEIDEPAVPTEDNPVGSYRRDFDVPPGWLERDVFINFGAVSSAFLVWVNGQYVGYSEGSKTPSEFEITPHLVAGNNTVAVEVYRWSTGSYLEDQDFWSLSGIQRSVDVFARPRQRIGDFFVLAGLDDGYRDGVLSLNVDVVSSDTSSGGGELGVRLMDADRVLYAGSAQLDLSDGGASHTFAASIGGVRVWSAETPQLYTLLLELRDAGGRTLESVVQRVGFRTVEIVNGRFLINGRRVKLKGTNLHEHHHVRGHVIDEQTMLEDIRLMKAANMNAVRNSHYPFPERWYELTSEHGLYVVDEANIESHGYGYDHDKTLGNKAHWMPHHLDRTRRMLERTKNFPSVVIWSLGNEAGDGVNLGATYKWIKSRDTSRPVQYETEGDIALVGERHSDFHSSMYWRYWDLDQYAQTSNDRPFLLIEYAHSMGNSTGNLAEYWDVIKRYDILAGGFIWDWVDQGLVEHTSDGRPYWTYGGDYGPPDVPSSGNFNFNGIVFPDRAVQPAYHEVHRVYQHVDFVPADLAAGEIRVINNYAFTDLDPFDLDWTISADGRTVVQGRERALKIDAQSVGSVRLPYDPGTLAAGPEYHLNLKMQAPKARGLLPAGHVYAAAQFELPSRVADFPVPPPAGSRVRVSQRGDRISIESADVGYAIDKRSGLLSSVRLDGAEMLLQPLRPDLWRAPIDNDFGNYMPDWAADWREADANRQLRSLQVVAQSAAGVEVAAVFEFFDAAGTRVATWHTDYSVMPSGMLQVQNRFEKEEGVAVVPRIGMNVQLDRALDAVEWFGRGPFENYVDRRLAADVGRYANTVADHYVPYMRPQENGYKTDVRWLSLSDRTSRALLVTTPGRISFGVHNNVRADFIPPVKIAITSEDGPGARNNDRRVNIHVSDIVPRDLVSLNIDYGQMGVGGDDSWGKRTLQKYSLNEKIYQYSFRLQPYRPEDGRLDALVGRARPSKGASR